MGTCCIIIPCYNESKRLNKTKIIEFQKNNNAFDLLFVNDGSTDNTLDVLISIASISNNINYLDLKINYGKAEAIRQSVLRLSKYDYIGYLDADLSTSLEDISRLLYFAKQESLSFVLGSRVKLIGHTIDRKYYRHFFGRIVATVIDSFILKLGVYDTQCGAKIIKSELVQVIFKQPFKTKWLFDVELLARFKKEKGINSCLKEIREVPLLEWKDTRDTRITFLEFLRTPLDLFRIYKSYR